MPGDELFGDAPGYNPLELPDYARIAANNTTRLLVSTHQDDWRGGRIDITEYAAPAPDVALHFAVPPKANEFGRSCVVDLLATTSFCATLTYAEAPSMPPRGGLLYNQPPKGRCYYPAAIGELVVGWPKVHIDPAPELQQLSDFTDEHSADAHRIVQSLDEMGNVVDRFGWALGLDRSDRQKFVGHLVLHVESARTYRQHNSV